MIVDSYLELVTTLYGWLFYNNVWYVLKDSGLLILPFIGIIFDGLMGFQGDSEEDLESRVIKSTTTKLITAIFVIMLCGSPYMEFEATEIIFVPQAMNTTSEEDDYDIDTMDATYGRGLSFANYPLNVEIPVFWYLVHNVSIGVTHSVINGTPPVSNLRRYIELLGRLKIDDPDLRKEVADFTRDCYIKSLSKYDREQPQKEGIYKDDIEDILDDEGEEDPYWIGSHVFLNTPGYYSSLRSEEIIDNFDYDADRDVEWDVLDPNLPTYGRPYCDQWWGNGGTGIRDRIIETTTFLETVSATIEAGLTMTTRQDLLIKVALSRSTTSFIPRGYDFAYSNSLHGTWSAVKEIKNVVKNVGVGVGATAENFKESFNVTAMLTAAPLIQPILMMLVTIFIPFVLALSKFNVSSVLMVAWAYFSFRFLTACWFFAWWIDQNMLAALFPEAGSITQIPISAYLDATSHVILQYLLNSLYYVIPLLFTIVSGWAGYNVIRGLGTSSMMGGLSSAAGNAAGKAGKALQGRLKK